MLTRVAEIVADELAVDPTRVTATARLDEDLHVDSLGLLTLLLRLEAEFGGRWVIETFPPVTTVADLCAVIDQEATIA
jgi:acyl carrier protein